MHILTSILFGATAATAVWPMLGWVDRINARYSGDILSRAQELGLDTSFGQTLLRSWWLFVMFVLWLFWVVFSMPPVAVVATLLAVSLPRTAIGIWAEYRRVKLRDQMVAACRSLASQLRAGLDVPSGLKSVAQDLSEPLKSEFQKLSNDYAYGGASLEEVMLSFKSRVRIEAVSLFTTVLLTCRKRGGDPTVAMEKISRSLEQLQNVELKLLTNTASGRLTIYVLAFFPFLFAFLFFLIDANSIHLLLTTWQGQWVIAIVMVLTYVAVRWAFYLIEAIE